MKDMPNNLPEDTAGKREGFRLFSDVFKWSMNTKASAYYLRGKNGEKKNHWDSSTILTSAVHRTWKHILVERTTKGVQDKQQIWSNRYTCFKLRFLWERIMEGKEWDWKTAQRILSSHICPAHAALTVTLSPYKHVLVIICTTQAGKAENIFFALAHFQAF